MSPAGRRTAARRAGPLALLLLLLIAGLAGPALAQPCLTCRTERCPTKDGVEAWCGEGKDPQARASPSRTVPGLRVESVPAGAAVRLDSAGGELLGMTPLKELGLRRGRHLLFFSLPGHEPASLRIFVDHGAPRRFEVALRPLPPVAAAPAPPGIRLPADLAIPAVEPPPAPLAVAAPPPKRTPIYKRWWFWTAIGGGVILTTVVTTTAVLATR